MYTHAKDHLHMLKSCSPCQSLVGYGHTKITQHALEVSVFRMLKLDTIQKKKKGRKKRRTNKKNKNDKDEVMMAYIIINILYPQNTHTHAQTRCPTTDLCSPVQPMV